MLIKRTCGVLKLQTTQELPRRKQVVETATTTVPDII